MKKIILFLFACFAKTSFLAAQAITLTTAPATANQTICVNTALSNISYNTSGGVTGSTVTGLPAGVTGTYSGGTNGTVTISGTGTVAGTFNYTVTTTGAGTAATTSGTITILPNVSLTIVSASGTNSQTVAINTPIMNIVYNAANGAGGVTATGLPAGITGTYSGGVFTISGTPTVAGTFNYTVTTVGGCSSASLNGTISVNAVGPGLTLTSASATAAQSVCINTAITNITYNSSGGVTNATITGLPPGVSGVYSGGTNGTVTISGIPATAGTYNYSVTTSGGGTPSTATGTIIVNSVTTITLSSGAGTTNQTVFANSPITPVTYTISGAGSATVSGLPAGVTGTFTGITLTISGSPVATGIFNYTVTPTGACGTVTATGTITVNAGSGITLSSAPNTTAQTVCINTLITNITYNTSGGVTNATVTGLPPGVSGAYSGGTNGTVTIAGTPTAAGTYSYTVTTAGGSAPVTATGSIIVVSATTITLTSGAGTGNQTVFISTPISNIVYNINGGAGNVTISGLPAGVTGSFAGTTLVISGIPTATGTFNYIITPTGGCGTATTATGTITVNPGPSIILSSAPGSNNQSICTGAAIIPITYITGGGVTNATVTGLPAGVTGVYSAGTFAISGTPAVTGTFSYTVTTSGGGGSVFVTGTIIISATAGITLTSAAATINQTICINNAITPVVYHATNGVTGIVVTGLPTGVTGIYGGGTNGIFTISGSGTSAGTYNYTVATTGGCSTAVLSGTITVLPNTTLTLASAANTNNQTVCVNTAIMNIVYVTGHGATVVSVSGLPQGVTGIYTGGVNGVLTISGTPTAGGVFNYTAATAGGCGNATVTGTITIATGGNCLVSSPNPTTGLARLFFSGGTANAQRGTVSVYNSRGTRVMVREMTLAGPSGTVEVDLGTNPAGTYLLIVRDAGGRKIGESRLVKF